MPNLTAPQTVAVRFEASARSQGASNQSGWQALRWHKLAWAIPSVSRCRCGRGRYLQAAKASVLSRSRSVRDDLEILGESAHGTGPPTRSGGRTAAKKTAHRFGSISSACFCLCRFKISWMTPCHIARGHVQTKPHLMSNARCAARQHRRDNGCRIPCRAGYPYLHVRLVICKQRQPTEDRIVHRFLLLVHRRLHPRIPAHGIPPDARPSSQHSRHPRSCRWQPLYERPPQSAFRSWIQQCTVGAVTRS